LQPELHLPMRLVSGECCSGGMTSRLEDRETWQRLTLLREYREYKERAVVNCVV
jgi:hypothetical protein